MKRLPAVSAPRARAVASGVAAAVAVALALGGCMVGPDYHAPSVAPPAAYRELPGWTQAAPDADGPKGDWWTAFHDPLLDELEPLVAVSNQTVRQDYYNYQQALALVREARAGLFPTLSATGSATRQRSAAAGVSSIGNSGALEGNVSWSPDLWGEVRRTLEERRASAQASAATYANATLSEQVTLATTVIDLRVTDANIDLLQATVKAYEDYLRVIADQDRAGTIPPSDLVTAQTQLDSARASLIALDESRAKYVHAIAVLVGRTPEDLTVAHDATLPALPDVPVGVPSTLLQRRPDIAVAERQMASANAAIGVAIAAYYPTISLSAAAGFSASPLAGLLHVANYVWSLGGSASETLFDGGLRSGEVAAARATYDAAVASYRGTVLAALQNVEDDLASVRVLAAQADALARAVTNAKRGAEIAFNEYQAGTVDYTTVSTAQATLLNLQQSALNVQQQRLVAAATLFGDLGGGWNVTRIDTVTPPARDAG
ncbi:efflux transporter outer membrane subunit [Burkholderia sp. FERM BP-3421]|jgi:NodT family efflux transporter outer membrane factor (OMF) lipoprotein|uniref:efflux transporter outer membrane subunit n=1 Tax=Burkholderia sp. FERM BP-3421 TaxID=1494466 RepID=UPI003FCD32BD